MGILKKVVHVLSNIAYVAVLVYLLVSLPVFFGYKPLVVLSGSMEPTYGVGSVIYYEVSQDIQVGDVIVFESQNSSFVTHRVTKIEGNQFVTKGDANGEEDPDKVQLQSVKGKVLNLNIPWVGYYIQYVNTHMWLVVVIVIILVSEFLLSNIKTKTDDKNNALEGGVNSE